LCRDDKTSWIVLGSCKLVIARNVHNHSAKKEEEEKKKKKKKKKTKEEEEEEEKKSAVHMTFSRGSRTSGHYALSWP